MNGKGESYPGRALVRVLAAVVCLAYFATSAVVVVNAFTWLPSMPSAWYQIQRVLYWPFKPYFALASSLLGGSSIPYGTYAAVTWSPFLLVPTAAALLLFRRGGKLQRKGRILARERPQPQ